MAISRKIKASINRIIHHGSRVYTVDLVPESRVPPFRPGQFLHLTIDEYSPGSFWPESRVFSIASSPANRDVLRICYAVKGRYTGRMEAEMREGGSAWVKLPYGDFVISLRRETLILAGGTGFTAFAAFLETMEPPPNQLHVLYGAREESLLIFEDLVRTQCRTLGAINAAIFCEQPGPDFAARNVDDQIRYEAGRVNLDSVWTRLANPMAMDCYIAGPPTMIQHFTLELRKRGIESTAIFVDAWE